MAKHKSESEAASVPQLYTEVQKERRTKILNSVVTLINNPVHVVSATPANVIMLVDHFFNHIEGNFIPNSNGTPSVNTKADLKTVES